MRITARRPCRRTSVRTTVRRGRQMSTLSELTEMSYSKQIRLGIDPSVVRMLQAESKAQAERGAKRRVNPRGEDIESQSMDVAGMREEL